MKTNVLLYIFSLVILTIAILMVVLYPEINRVQAIAGGLTMVGFSLNIAGFVLKKR